jgi:hypothetical protein
MAWTGKTTASDPYLRSTGLFCLKFSADSAVLDKLLSIPKTAERKLPITRHDMGDEYVQPSANRIQICDPPCPPVRNESLNNIRLKDFFAFRSKLEQAYSV